MLLDGLMTRQADVYHVRSPYVHTSVMDVMAGFVPVSHERDIERRIAAHLARALDQLVQQTRPRLTNQDVLAGCAEFLTQMCLKAFVYERAEGYPHTLANPHTNVSP